MIEIELGDCKSMERPARYSSSAMKLSEMKNVKKLSIKKTLVAHKVDLCL